MQEGNYSLAERARFELADPLTGRKFSKLLHSATMRSLQDGAWLLRGMVN